MTRAVMYSRLEPLKEVARRIRPHFDAIVAAYQHGIKLKIFQRCSLPSNPWAHIVL